MVFCLRFFPRKLEKKGFFQSNNTEIQRFYDRHSPIDSKVVQSFWAYLEWLSRNWAEFAKNLQDFWGEFQKSHFFFKILIIKTSNIISNMNYWCSEDSFEVLHVSLAQKLTNPKFSPMIFLFLPSVSSATSWGQINGLRNLTRVPN